MLELLDATVSIERCKLEVSKKPPICVAMYGYHDSGDNHGLDELDIDDPLQQLKGPKECDAEPVTYAMMALTGVEQDDWSMEFDAEHVHFGQDGLGDFDWSNKADDAPVSLALMATNSEIRDLKLEEKQKELDQALKERDDFKVKLEKWSNASVLQNEVLNKQRYVSDKSCIGFGIESSNSMESDISSGDETLTDSTYENFKREKAYKAVPPPTDWVDSDDEETDVSESQKETAFNTENSEESFENSPNHLIKDCNLHERTFQHTQTHNLRNTGFKETRTARPKMTQTVPSKSTANVTYQDTARSRVPQAVLSRSTDGSYYQRMDSRRPRISSYSPSSRSSTTRTPNRPQRPKKIVKSIWGNPEEDLKDYAIIDSGCSGSMTGDKDKLSDFKEFKGGYVAFGNDSKDKECLILSPSSMFLSEDWANSTGPSCKKIEEKNCQRTSELLHRSCLDLFQLERVNRKQREYSIARTPQQNGVAERKNRTLIEAARTMLADSLLPIQFWAEAVNTACYVLNRVLVTKPQMKTPYEILMGRSPNISFMRPFGCPLTILNTLDHLGKFDGKSEEGYLLGYSTNSKGFRVYNRVTRKVQDCLHVNFLENQENQKGKGPDWMFDLDLLTPSMNYIPVRKENYADSKEQGITCDDAEDLDDQQFIVHNPSSLCLQRNVLLQKKCSSLPHLESIRFIPKRPKLLARSTRWAFKQKESFKTVLQINIKHYCLLYTSKIELTTKISKQLLLVLISKRTKESLSSLSNMKVGLKRMQEELLQFKLQEVWVLCDLPEGKRVIGTKWVFRNKRDERGTIIKNKARLVAQGYRQEEGVDYDEKRWEELVRVRGWVELYGIRWGEGLYYGVDDMANDVYLPQSLEERVQFEIEKRGEWRGYQEDAVRYKRCFAKNEAIRLSLAIASFMGFIAIRCIQTCIHISNNTEEDMDIGEGLLKKTLFIKKERRDINVEQIYVDDIIFLDLPISMLNGFRRSYDKKNSR
ncbi:retrovirus-related pol polyprotein from transposon TNT 1-94 [Tanacetum coccineum]